MADDINLPNLISHLAVNLDGLQGTIADASRQGSSVGSALGGGIQRELQGLLAHLPDIPIDANSDEVDRDLARVRRELEELGTQRIGIDIPVDQAIRRINELTPHLQRLSDTHPRIDVQAATRQASRQLDELLAAAHRVDDTDVRIDVDVDEDRPNRLTGILGRLSGAAAGARGALTGVATSAAKIGAAIPAAASLVTTLANVAPAAGVAVTGMAALQLASGTVKLAAVGMDDALTAALDPSKAEDFDEALKKLSPNAAAFATTVRDMGPALRDMQQAVQNEVFRGLADNLERTAKSVLPVLRKELLNSATALGDMAAGAMGAARDLAENGTLGQALASASKGLRNLSGVPGIVVTALGQIAAAAGPSFESLTDGAAHAAARIGERLGKAFESGEMQKAIEHAMDLLGEMITVGANVAKIIGSIFNAVPAGGGGLIGVLQDITGELAKIAGSDEVQAAFRALFEVIGAIGQTAAPLLAQALSAIAPIVSTLGPPLQTLIESLGAGLSPIIDALGPVLLAAAGAVGALVEAASPLLVVAGELVASLLPALTPLLDACTVVFEALAPVVAEVATILSETLSPILAELPGIIGPLAEILADELVFFLGLLAEILKQVGPSLVILGQSFGEILVALSPLLEALARLVSEGLSALLPLLVPLIELVGKLAAILADRLASVITNVVVPAIQILTELLRGDFSGALNIARDAAINIAARTAAEFSALPGKVSRGVSGLATALRDQMILASARTLSAAQAGIANVVREVASLPGKARGAMNGIGDALWNAGASLISGFISGIRSKIGEVQGILSDLTSRLPDWKGPKAKDARILTPAGRLLIEGFIRGIDETTAKLRSRLQSITKALPANVRSGVAKSLAKATAELSREITRRDGVLKRLATAQKKLDDLTKARSKAAGDITKGILDEGNITSGHGDVNSVSAIMVGLQVALKAAKDFQANIAKLKSSGLRSDLLQQIADAGVSGGAATAAALARATPAELKRINDLQAQLAKSATATGNTVGDALYGAGIQAAKGLVAGLKSQERQIEATMRRIAEGMLKTVKKAHKTHSPSEEFRDIGAMDMEGWRGGVLANATRVLSAARDVAAGVLDAASGVGGALAATPTAGQLAAVYAGGSGGDQHNTFNLYGAEASPDGILRALSWQGLVKGR